MAKTRDFGAVLEKRVQSDPDLAAVVEREAFKANVAFQIYNARIAAGLTQKQLANHIGSQQSVIARLEDADYEGHSLSMLRRIAEALNCSLAVSLAPKTKATSRTVKKRS